MTRTSRSPAPQQATIGTLGAWQAPTLDPATVDFYLRRGRQERARAFAEMIRSVFSSPEPRRSADVRELPACRPAAPAMNRPERSGRAA